MSVSKDKYDNFREAALAGGALASEVERAISNMKREEAKIEAGICPHCGSKKLTRTLDLRQAGPTQVAGKWFNYRCGHCKWFGDRCEPIGEN